MDNKDLFANQRPRVVVNKCLHVKRLLYGKGKLKVKVGEEVTPSDILGESVLPTGFSGINLAKKLGVSASEGTKYLQKPIGAKIFQGELLAFKKSWFGKKIIQAPTDGVIQNYDPQSGRLFLQFEPKVTPLTAGVFGIVDSVDEISGEVLIKTMVTEVFGMIGSGQERSGTLKFLGNQSSLVNNNQITNVLDGHIIVSGAVIFGETLRKAVSCGVAGVISGGLNYRDFQSITGNSGPDRDLGSDVGISVLATEGFGPLPIGDDIFNLMKLYEDKYVFIIGNTHQLLLPSPRADSIISLRKIVIPVTKVPEVLTEPNIGEIKLQSKIRIVWPPYMGVQGTIIQIDKSPTLLKSGISSIMVTVETQNSKIRIPSNNLELI